MILLLHPSFLGLPRINKGSSRMRLTPSPAETLHEHHTRDENFEELSEYEFLRIAHRRHSSLVIELVSNLNSFYMKTMAMRI